VAPWRSGCKSLGQRVRWRRWSGDGLAMTRRLHFPTVVELFVGPLGFVSCEFDQPSLGQFEAILLQDPESVGRSPHLPCAGEVRWPMGMEVRMVC
jgi:hypothetical protein